MKLIFMAPEFAAAVKDGLARRGWSYADACAAAPFVDGRMISRAVNGERQEVAQYLAVCAALDLDPFAYAGGFAHGKVIKIQPVTHGVSRETRAAKEI